MTTAPLSSPRDSAWKRRGRLLGLAVGGGLLASVNMWLAARSIGSIIGGAPAVDWGQYVEAARRLATSGELYAVTDTYAYRYSPFLAPVFGLLGPLGTTAWRLLHVAAALALPTWPLRLVTLASWPFWYDVETGNVMVFILLAAAWALRGSRVATGTFLVVMFLLPRPLMLPLAAWLLWQRAEWRTPFVGAFAFHAGVVLVTGWAGPWLGTLVAAGADASLPSNVGPNRFIGTVPWLLIGIPLAAWLTWRGRIGFASIAASPYWLPYYLLMPLLELVRVRSRRLSTEPAR